ncbi:MAG: GNAT family N-acetyltransferase [Microbacteriaceae bacterium]
MIIRPIEQRDESRWRGLFREYGVFYKTAFDDDVIAGVWTWLMDAEPRVRALVAVADGTVVGFTHFREHADTFTAASGWFLDDLYVTPEARGIGAATSLIEGVMAFASTHGGGTVRWITAEDNVTAQSVYDKVATRSTWVTYEKES